MKIIDNKRKVPLICNIRHQEVSSTPSLIIRDIRRNPLICTAQHNGADMTALSSADVWHVSPQPRSSRLISSTLFASPIYSSFVTPTLELCRFTAEVQPQACSVRFTYWQAIYFEKCHPTKTDLQIVARSHLYYPPYSHFFHSWICSKNFQSSLVTPTSLTFDNGLWCVNVNFTCAM